MTEEAYIKIHVEVSAEQQAAFIALLSEADFYAFEEHDGAVDAYILEKDYSEERLGEILARHFPEAAQGMQKERIEPMDWNAEWERNFESTVVEDLLEIHPPFRSPKAQTRLQILVNPRMAFGTGQHATTWMMARYCFELEMEGKKVLDMGCGTGVLGILAKKLGASSVCLIDFDPWCTENTAENASLNGLEDLEIILGDATAIPENACYDILLANINRNILMADRDKYLQHLKVGGMLVLSGIYDFDEGILTQHFLEAGLKLKGRAERKEWVRLAFEKINTSGNENCL